MPEPISFLFKAPMSLKDQLENQMAQLNCSLATQIQLASVGIYPASWTSCSVPMTPYSIQTYCCEDGSSFKPRKTNCINCGATLSGRHKCSYCDTYNE